MIDKQVMTKIKKIIASKDSKVAFFSEYLN